MELVKQSRRGYCLITSFAMCLDVEVSELIAHLGHDGTEIVSDCEEPECFRGFHTQELIDIAMLYDFAVITIEGQPTLSIDDKLISAFANNEERFQQHILSTNTGIILGQTKSGMAHAVGVDGIKQIIYDPMGYKYGFGECQKYGFTDWDTLLRFVPTIKSNTERK